MTTEQTAPAAPASSRRAGVSADRDRRRGWLSFLRDVIIIVLVAVLVSFLVKTFLVRSFYIPSGSMESTLLVNDRILVDEITPRFGGYERGDIVVFRDPGGWLPVRTDPPRSPLVEAVDWALSLVCCNDFGQLTVNGVPLDEREYLKLPSADSPASADPFDVTVPEDRLWVLGDNRYSSKDSRYNQDQPGKGFVPVENVVGRAFLITGPFPRFGALDFHHDVFAGVSEPTAEPASK